MTPSDFKGPGDFKGPDDFKGLDDLNGLRAFEDLLDRHGGDLARWPERARERAEVLLETSAPARERLALMREAERLLSLSRAIPATGTDVGIDRIAARAMRGRQLRPARRALHRAGWAAAAAAALAIGILVGGAEGVQHDDEAGFAVATGSAETSYVE